MVLQSPRGIESGYGVNVRNAGLRHPFFSDLGNTSEIANSLVLGGRSIKLELRVHFKLGRHYAKAEDTRRIGGASTNSKRRTKPCRIRLTQSRTSSKEKRTTTRKTRASLRCRLAQGSEPNHRPAFAAKSQRMQSSRKALPLVWRDCAIDGGPRRR